MHDEGNKAQKMKQYPEKWGGGYFRCTFVAKFSFMLSQMRVTLLFRSFVNHQYINRIIKIDINNIS